MFIKLLYFLSNIHKIFISIVFDSLQIATIPNQSPYNTKALNYILIQIQQFQTGQVHNPGPLPRNPIAVEVQFL
jgi:type III secretory pathway component EscT